MPAHKTSPVWTTPPNEFEEIIKKASSIADVLRHFNFANGMHKTIIARCKQDNIDISHIQLGIGSNKGKTFNKQCAIPLENVMTENSTYSRCHLKKRLLRNGMLENKCSICGQLPEWKGLNLVMVLDHINGIRDDNRKENLRLVCPNCNSQLPTFTGRQNKIKRFCKDCGKQIKKESERCYSCANKINNRSKRKVENRPDIDTLKKEFEEMGYEAMGRKYGVTGKAIKKWMK